MFVALGGYLTIAVANSVRWRLPQSPRGSSANLGLFGGVVALSLVLAMLGALGAGLAAGGAVHKGVPVGRVAFPFLLGAIHVRMRLMALPVILFGR